MAKTKVIDLSSEGNWLREGRAGLIKRLAVLLKKKLKNGQYIIDKDDSYYDIVSNKKNVLKLKKYGIIVDREANGDLMVNQKG